jgi:CBS domain-containing protein
MEPFLLFLEVMQTIESGSARGSSWTSRVEARMSQPATTVRPEASLREIERHFVEKRISGVPVVYDDQRLVGVVTTSDLLALPNPIAIDRVASDVMSPAVVIAHPEEKLDEALWRMVAGRVHRVVVIDRTEHVLGVLSPSDAMRDLKARRIDVPIERIMSAPVEVVSVSASIDTAIRQLSSANVHGLVVVDGTTPVGVFTHHEALACLRPSASPGRRTVEDAMSYEMLCLDVATPVARAAAYLDAMRVRRLVVVRDRQLVGVVSALELAGVLAHVRAPVEES